MGAVIQYANGIRTVLFGDSRRRLEGVYQGGLGTNLNLRQFVVGPGRITKVGRYDRICCHEGTGCGRPRLLFAGVRHVIRTVAPGQEKEEKENEGFHRR